MITPKPLRPKRCKVCRTSFVPRNPMQIVCGWECSQVWAKSQREKKEAKEAAQERKKTRAQLEAIKTRPRLEKEVEEAMNRYVRLRDFTKGCISCGRAFNPNQIGGSCDAGHFRSKGSAKHLRFDPRNLHAQCKHCNDRLAGNPIGYERGLIAKIGAQAVEDLKCDQAPRKFTKDELRAMREHYRAEVRKLTSKSQPQPVSASP